MHLLSENELTGIDSPHCTIINEKMIMQAESVQSYLNYQWENYDGFVIKKFC